MIRIVQFLNQVQAGLGGDEQMDVKPQSVSGAVGMGMLMRGMLLRSGADIVGTVICGDHYFLENRPEAVRLVAEQIDRFGPDVVVCGPALSHKRFGECCGWMAEYLEKERHVPAFAAMAASSTGTPIFRDRVYIIETPKVGGTGLNSSLKKIANFAVKLATRQPIGSPEEEGYFRQEKPMER